MQQQRSGAQQLPITNFYKSSVAKANGQQQQQTALRQLL
jgi:hypothetical protein